MPKIEEKEFTAVTLKKVPREMSRTLRMYAAATGLKSVEAAILDALDRSPDLIEIEKFFRRKTA